MLKTFLAKGAKVRLLVRAFNEHLESEIRDNLEFRAIEKNEKTIISVPLDINPKWKNFIQNNIEDFNPDLIIVREMFLSSLVSSLVKDTKIPVLMDMAENYPAAMKSWKKYNSRVLPKLFIHKFEYPKRIERRAVQKVDGVVVVCDEQMERLHAEYGTDTERMVCIYNSPMKDLIPPDVKKNQNEQPVFIHHGMMTSEKSLTNFILACKIIFDREIRIKVLLPGFGDCMEDYKYLTQKLGIHSMFDFTGPYDGSKLGYLLSVADCGLIPYELNEFNDYTLHNKLFEYFALGLPVIVTPMIPTAKIVQYTGAGIVAKSASPDDIADAIITFLQSESKSMSQASSAAHMTYNWDEEEKKLLNFLNNFEKRHV